MCVPPGYVMVDVDNDVHVQLCRKHRFSRKRAHTAERLLIQTACSEELIITCLGTVGSQADCCLSWQSFLNRQKLYYVTTTQTFHHNLLLLLCLFFYSFSCICYNLSAYINTEGISVFTFHCGQRCATVIVAV